MMLRLRTRPPVFFGHRPPILTHRMCMRGSHASGRDSPQYVGGPFALAKDSMPDLEVDEEPQTIAVRRPAGAMLVDEPANRGPFEVAARQRALAEDEFVDD